LQKQKIQNYKIKQRFKICFRLKSIKSNLGLIFFLKKIASLLDFSFLVCYNLKVIGQIALKGHFKFLLPERTQTFVFFDFYEFV
jgi:hypothetical protein